MDNLYLQGVVAGDTFYVSGYGSVDPEMGEEIDGDTEAQTGRVFDNIVIVVSEAGGDNLDDAMKLAVYVTDFDGYEWVNGAYDARFDKILSARVYIEMTRLLGGARIEMDVITYLGQVADAGTGRRDAPA